MKLRLVTIVTLLLTQLGLADPCGMVPPMIVPPGVGPPISRVGVQQTYAFYKDGMETLVIRPGFEGRVEEFGMLIPFPSPPSVRKVPDAIFGHIAAAVDPPEVLAYVTRLQARRMKVIAGYSSNSYSHEAKSLQLKKSEVRVLREEAVGMYEVAVLEAGSASALQKWMDGHQYRYPEGMDTPCEEYISQGWCFVAIKTRVGQKSGADPRPGMRNVDLRKPADSEFEGHVQGMGFRFPSRELVIPMRLSVFNGDDLRNIVYVLADKPLRIQGINKNTVVRQVSGKELLKNLTKLPLRVIGGEYDDLAEWQKQNLPAQRDPKPFNGIARALFGSDLLALNNDTLVHQFEQREKLLLEIGERLNLRGAQADALNESLLEEVRKELVDGALSELEGMTMTVIDGDFPRDLLTRENLRFLAYQMPPEKNRPELYNAVAQGPKANFSGGYLVQDREPELKSAAPDLSIQEASATPAPPSPVNLQLVGLVISLSLGLILLRKNSHLGGLAFLAVACCSTALWADDLQQHFAGLTDPIKARHHADELILAGPAAIPGLLELAKEDQDLVRRGFALACLAKIGDPKVEAELTLLYADPKQPTAVRTWAAAARCQLIQELPALASLANLQAQFPALKRPLSLAAKRLSVDSELEEILTFAGDHPALRSALSPTILKAGAEPLVTELVGAGNNSARSMAAASLATLSAQGDRSVTRHLLKALRFDPEATEAPWQGGALFLPTLQGDRQASVDLVDSLIQWYLWCELNDQPRAVTQPIENNLRGPQLWSQFRGWTYQWIPVHTGAEAWLTRWGSIVGHERIAQIRRLQR